MSLVTWARTRDSKKIEAKRKVEKLPESETGRGKAVPFPYKDRSFIKDDFSASQINAAIKAAPIETVLLNGLHAIQYSVRAPTVERYIDHPDHKAKGVGDPDHPVDHPIVMEYKGIRMVWDGHHRIVALKLQGEKTAKVRLVNLDNLET